MRGDEPGVRALNEDAAMTNGFAWMTNAALLTTHAAVLMTNHAGLMTKPATLMIHASALTTDGDVWIAIAGVAMIAVPVGIAFSL